MKKRIEKGIKTIKDNPVILTILPWENFHELNIRILKTLLKQNILGAYVSVNRPYENLLKVMKANDVDHSKILFIDCISDRSNNSDNCVFVGSAQSLTNIGIALEPVYKSEKHDFIFLDSLDALSLYHKPEMIIRFGRSIINKIRENSMYGIMLGLSEDTNRQIINELSAVADMVLDLTKD